MERLLTKHEAAALLGVSVRFVEERVRDKRPERRIKAYKIGSLVRFHDADLEDYVCRQEVARETKRKAGRPRRLPTWQIRKMIENELAVQALEKMGFTVGGPES